MADADESAPGSSDLHAPARREATLEPAVRTLDPRVITLQRIAGSITGGVLAGLHILAIVIVAFASSWPRWAVLLFALSWIPMAALLLWLAIGWPAIDYRHWSYRVDHDGIEIRSGVLWRQIVSVPRSRVQHIDVSQGPIERWIGLATLSIHTAGTEYSKVDLPGLDHEVALTLRDALLPRDVQPAV